jgi:hypothetical protein
MIILWIYKIRSVKISEKANGELLSKVLESASMQFFWVNILGWY